MTDICHEVSLEEAVCSHQNNLAKNKKKKGKQGWT